MKVVEQFVGDRVDDVWDAAAPILQLALDHGLGEFDMKHVHDSCVNGNMQLFLGFELGKLKAAAVTSIITYPSIKVVRFVLAAGRGFNEFVNEYMDYIGIWAAANGASALESWNRPAMSRYLQRFGAEKVYEVNRISLERYMK